MRFHIPCLPHTDLTRDFDWCAYTAKCRRFATMMTAEGHTVITYGGPHADHPGEHVTVVTDNDRARWFPGYDRTVDVWDGFDMNAAWWVEMNRRISKLIPHRYQPGDILGIIAGVCQSQIVADHPEMTAVEWGIGYAGVFAPHRVFESYAWMHYLAARAPTDDIRLYDTVIPNSFDDTDFTPTYTPGDYLLYLGRMTPRKGLPIIQAITDRTALPVVTVGQGTERINGATHLGVRTGTDKAGLLAGARAVLVPSMYLEPFGGVAVEAMLSGTPVITTDYGAFTETVEQGVGGFRCSTLDEFMDAIDRTADIDRTLVRDHAERYLTANVAPRYSRYFEQVNQLWDRNWDGTPV